MTYGSLGENYELVLPNLAGISLRRAMYPKDGGSGNFKHNSLLFSDYMLPIANLKYFSLLYVMPVNKSRQILLPENVFSNRFPGYSHPRKARS